jgi:histidine triad (HIT) family protein
MIKLKLSKLMNWKPAQKIFSWGLEHAAFVLPVKPLRQTAHWMAFTHPNPSYPIHIILVPKGQVRDWLSVEPGQMDLDTTREFIELTQSMIREFELADTGYRLILNGGDYQTFPHLHIHLVSGDAITTQDE